MGAIAFKEIHHIKKPDKEFTFILEEETITTNNNPLYVGKTSEYIFLYDKDKDMSRIIKTEAMKEMRALNLQDDK